MPRIRLSAWLLVQVLGVASAAVAADAYTLGFSTYLGGSGGQDENHGDMTVDSAGNVYIVGETDSRDFPVTSGSYIGGSMDAFVAKYDASGVRQWSRFYGTASFDHFLTADLDSTERYLYVSGRCGRGLATTAGVLQSSFGGYGSSGVYGETNACIFRLRTSDGSIDAVTYWGTAQATRDLAVCPNGDLVVCEGYEASGQSLQPAAWSAGRYQPDPLGGDDAYVAVVSPDLTTVRWGSYVGGSRSENHSSSCACDRANNVISAVCTDSSDLDVSRAGYDASYSGGRDGYVAKLNPTGTALLWGTYHGGTAWDCPGSKNGVATNSSGDVIVQSGTFSSDMRTTAGAYDRSHNGSMDRHLAVIAGSDGSLSFATFFGGSDREESEGVKVGPGDEILFAGSTISNDMPTTSGAYDSTHNGDADAFVAKFSSDLSALLYASYMGTSALDSFRAMALGAGNEITASGHSASASWPTKNADQPTFGGGAQDAVTVRFAIGSPPPLPLPPPQNVHRTDSK